MPSRLTIHKKTLLLTDILKGLTYPDTDIVSNMDSVDDKTLFSAMIAAQICLNVQIRRHSFLSLYAKGNKFICFPHCKRQGQSAFLN